MPGFESDEERAARLWEEDQERLRKQREETPDASGPAAVAKQTDPLADVLSQLKGRVLNAKPSAQEAEMADLWRRNEKSALEKLNGGESAENWAVGLGTALPMLAGIIADVATPNAYGVRGTGLGRIAEAGAQNAQQLFAQSNARKQQAQSLAEAAAGVRKQGQDRDVERLSKFAQLMQENQRIGIARDNLGIRGADTALKTAAQDFRLNPTNAQATVFKNYLKQLRPDLAQHIDALGMDALQRASHQINQQTDDAHFPVELVQAAQKAGATSAASTGARINTEANLAPVSAATESFIKGATTKAGVAAERAAQAANRPAPAGYVVDDPEIFDNVNQDQASRTKMSTVAAAGHSIADSSARIKELRRKYGTKVLPGGEQTEVETIKTNLIGQLAQLSGQGVVNPGERLVWDQVMPGLQGNLTDIIGKLSGSDLKLDQLEGLERATRALVESSASQYGLKYVGLEKARTARQSAPKSGAESKWSGRASTSGSPAESKWSSKKR